MFSFPRISRVAIIGAGPGGIAAARALRAEGDVFEKITLFERNAAVGGTWIYSPETNATPPMPSVNALQVDPPCQAAPPHPPKSPMYQELHTNLPSDVMAFRDIAFPSGTPTFPDRKQVLDYVEHVATQEGLKPLIRFNSTVTRVDPLHDNTWQVSVTDQNGDGKKEYQEQYDAVIVASGHYYVPYVPDFVGLSDYVKTSKVTVMHSREYRKASDFKNKNVLVVGSGSSGSDIVRQITDVASNVYHCVRTHTSFSQSLHDNAPANLQLVGPLTTFHPTTGAIDYQEHHNNDNSRQLVNLDAVIFATGYLFSFPFLPFEKDAIIVDGQNVTGLYKWMFYMNNPTLSFVGLPIRVVPMPLMQSQSTVIARVLSQRIPLPSTTIMQSHVTTVSNNDRHSIVMGAQTEFDYVESLSAWAENKANDMDAWRNQSTDIITGPLSERWKERRQRSLQLRLECLGY